MFILLFVVTCISCSSKYTIYPCEKEYIKDRSYTNIKIPYKSKIIIELENIPDENIIISTKKNKYELLEVDKRFISTDYVLEGVYDLYPSNLNISGVVLIPFNSDINSKGDAYIKSARPLKKISKDSVSVCRADKNDWYVVPENKCKNSVVQIKFVTPYSGYVKATTVIDGVQNILKNRKTVTERTNKKVYINVVSKDTFDDSVYEYIIKGERLCQPVSESYKIVKLVDSNKKGSWFLLDGGSDEGIYTDMFFSAYDTVEKRYFSCRIISNDNMKSICYFDKKTFQEIPQRVVFLNYK